MHLKNNSLAMRARSLVLDRDAQLVTPQLLLRVLQLQQSHPELHPCGLVILPRPELLLDL